MARLLGLIFSTVVVERESAQDWPPWAVTLASHNLQHSTRRSSIPFLWQPPLHLLSETHVFFIIAKGHTH